MPIDIRPVSEEDARTNAVRAAQLVYSTGDKVFDMLLGGRERAGEVLTVMFPQKDSWCGYNLTTGAFDGDELVGIETGYDLPTRTRQNANSPSFAILNKMLSPSEMTHLGALQPYLPYLMHEHTPDDAYYVLNLASDPNQRGKGIGKMLLQNAYNQASEQGLKLVQLDVFNNKPAVPFYLSQGMEVYSETVVPKFRDEFGVPPFLRMVKWL